MPLTLRASHSQAEIITDDTPVQILCAGRRWGKNFTGRNKLIYVATRKPGGHSWYVGPSYAKAREEYDELVSAAAGLITACHTQPYPQITWYNGHRTGFRSLDKPKYLVGAQLDFLWLDEGAHVSGDKFRQALRPMVLDRNGRILITSTFYGFNWFYDYYQMAIKGTTGYRAWLFPTWTGPAFTGENDPRLEQLRSEYPGALWDQEIACIPAAKANAVFRLRDLELCIGGAPAIQPQHGRQYALGWDIGRLVDPSAWVLLDDQYQIGQTGIRPMRETHEDGARICGKITRMFNASLMVDSTGGGKGGSSRKDQDSVVEEYRRAVPGLREWVFTTNNKRRLVEYLGLLIERHSLRIPPQCRDLYEQLANYEYSRSGDQTRYHGPGGHDDDLVSGLGMAAWMQKVGWCRKPTGRMPLTA